MACVDQLCLHQISAAAAVLINCVCTRYLPLLLPPLLLLLLQPCCAV
jgi:hypothetical protein